MDLYISFFLASVLLAITPGPDNIFVLVQSLAQGARAGIAITLGLCTGLVVHTSLVAFGVAEFISQTRLALPILALFGAAYLGYLAWMSWHAGLVQVNASSDGQSASVNGWRLYGRGVVMNLTNPKVLLFFLAFLPQFVQGGVAVAQQIFALGGVFIVAALLVFCGIALACAKVQPLINHQGVGQVWLNRAVALVFALLAVRLIWVAVNLLTATQ
ncbi:LysE family translocator [Halioxenophilus aromaticivorans]|uniref:LysE family translocator n=1 Tax=Halioxenophilus aromaticivorans TaxID=1306992 RepID=A0AAV3U133_9ALTE